MGGLHTAISGNMQTIKVILPPLKQWQRDVYDKVINQGGSGRLFCLKSARQKGKSVLANTLLVSYLLSSRCDCVVIEPVIAQARRMFLQVYNWLKGGGVIESANSTLLSMTFVNGSTCIWKSAAQEENLRGFSVSRNGILIIDEGAYIKDEVFEILWPLIDANQAPCLVISTPLFCSGTFYELFMRGLSDDYENITSFDWAKGYDMSEMLPPEKLEYYRQTMSPLKFRSEYLAEFIEEGALVFLNFQKCYGLSQKPPKYAGIDWSAGNDGDYTVLVFMDEDCAVTDIKSWKNFDSSDLISHIASEINSRPTVTTVQVELNSIGKIFYDSLRKKIDKRFIKGFVTTNESKRQVIEQLIEAFQQETITIPEDKELTRELQFYAMEKTKNGSITYNGTPGVNDDYVIALALVYDAVIKNNNKGFRIGFA